MSLDFSSPELEPGTTQTHQTGRYNIEHTVSATPLANVKKVDISVVLDADTPTPGIDALLRRVDFPIVSREFAEKHFGTRNPLDCLRGLGSLGARFPVVTLGDRGAVAGGREGVIESPAFQVAVRDTTGAGDVFHAAFIWGLLEGMSGTRILEVANAAAAMNCRALGAQGGLPSREELEDFLLGAQVRA